MANAFDQFDTQAPAATTPAANPFDKFDSEKLSTTGDIFKSGVAGVGKGMIAGAGGAGDVRNAASAATDYVGKKLGVSPETIDKIKTAAPIAAQAVPFVGPALGMIANAPSSGDIQKGVESVTGEFHKPQTTAGRYAETAGEFAGNPASYIGPGGFFGKAATAIGSGLGSEAAGDLTEKFAPDAPKTKAAMKLIGAIAGGHGVGVAPRVVTPNIIGPERQALIDTLDREGIPLTAGDRTGGTQLKAAESELSPGANDAQRQAFQQAAFNRVGEHIGERPVQGPNGAVTTMMQRIGQQFDGLSGRNNVARDPQLVNELQNVRSTYNDTPGLYPQETVNSVNAAVDRIHSAFNQNPGAPLSGADYQTLRSNLRRAAQGATDPQRAEGLHDVTNALDDAMERSIQRTNPQDAGAWAQARRNYQNGLVLERWAGSANMTPSTLAQAAKAVYGKRAYVRGTDDFSDLAEAGRNVLKQYQDSGTARRLQIEGALKGVGGVLGFLTGAAHGDPASAAEGGVAGLLLGENVAPFVARPAARGALMNPVTQGYLGNQVAPVRVGTSPETIAAVNAIRGNQGDDQKRLYVSPNQQAPVPGARQAKDGKWYVPDPNRNGKFMMVNP